MLRIILKREQYDAHSGCREQNFITIDVEAPEVERALSSGGFGESGYDVTHIIGVEVK